MAAQGEAHRPKQGSRRALAQLKRPMARVIFDEDCEPVLQAFAAGEFLTRAVKRHRLDWFAFRRFMATTPERAAQMAEAERMHAWHLMEKALFTADGLLKKSKSVGALMAYYRIARDWGKALDNQRWGDKVEVAARALLINTNVGADASATGTGESTFTMMIEEPVDCTSTISGADTHLPLLESTAETDLGVA